MATPRKTRLKIGVIGLGIIGSRVAANLRAAGHQVYVWSRSPHSAPNFLGSVVEVADLCDIIQIFVSDEAALLEVTRTMAAALGPRHVVTVHATISPDAARRTASIVESLGARYLDAPFTGSKVAAQNGQLVYYVGGSEEALGEVRPALEASSKKILHVGGIGDASVLKIATNMLTATTVQTLAEALALVRSAGVDGAMLVQALENNASRSGTSDLKLPTMLAQNFEPNFSLKHMLKDVRLAKDLAEKGHIKMPVTESTEAVLAQSMEKGWGDDDFSALARNYDLPPLAKAASTVAAPPGDTGPGKASGSKDSAPPSASGEETPPHPPEKPEPSSGEPTPPADKNVPVTSEALVSTRAIVADLNRAKKNTLRIIRDFFKPEAVLRK